MLLYSILNATEAIYQRLLFLRGKNGESVRNCGQFSIFCTGKKRPTSAVKIQKNLDTMSWDQP